MFVRILSLSLRPDHSIFESDNQDRARVESAAYVSPLIQGPGAVLTIALNLACGLMPNARFRAVSYPSSILSSR